ncbi:MAG: nuclear transport factor 2 family protein [Rubrivivax sp.]|nr:nuclear transport factor 2 family protein [Rubrivivax sp.]
MDVNELIEVYIGAWGEPQRQRRLALLEQAWAEDGLYADPSAHVAGRTALADHIGGVLRRSPGARFALTSAVQVHHRFLRFGWRMVLPDGSVPVEGLDIGDLSPAGQLQRIVGFFGPLPAQR